MRTLMVDYDLNRPEQNYEGLIAHLRTYANWCRFLRSSWLIKTERTAVQVRDDLLPLIDNSDDVMVMEVTSAAAAWYGLSDEISQWIKDNL